MRRSSSTVALLLFVLLALLGPGIARASATYPAEMQSQLGLSYTPACAICHANGVTGYGTVTTPFGEAMRAVGLVCCSIPSLDGALAALEAENSPYISDLKQGLDPNNPGAGSVPPPVYGCVSVTGPPPTPIGNGVVLLALALLGLASRRRRQAGAGPRRGA
ncbi:MAG: MYXO-CTERM sorting domain-containing protein [Myxococcaceae bacterium]